LRYIRFRATPLLAVLAAPCTAAVNAPAAYAQQPPATTSVDSLRAELARLRQQLDSLSRIVARGGAAQTADSAADPIAAIRAAAAAALAEDTTAAGGAAVGEGEFVGRQRNLNVFNPEISVTGDIFAFVRSDAADEENFVPREFELALQSNLDPYSRAKVFVAHHRHGGEIEPFEAHLDGEPGEEEEHGHAEAETEIEEGYVEWVNLPGGFGVTLGKFRQRFGKLNRWHTHALPAQHLPLPYVAFLGEEGLAQTGASVHWLLPLHGAGTYEVWTEVTRSESDVVFGESSSVSVLGHVNGFWQLSPATYLELGASALAGSHVEEELEADFGGRVYGLDLTLDWTPPAMAKYRQATLHTGVLLSRSPLAGGDDARGAFAIGEFKFAQQWIAGARWEWTENPLEPVESTWLVAPSLTWWQSEFVRLRAAYEFVDRVGERFGQFVIQTTFAMGPHKHETY
jgi:hypothetical protein